ncbi:hypothetical protein lerEdw1_020838, partial [Lerista edwardsae]
YCQPQQVLCHAFPLCLSATSDTCPNLLGDEVMPGQFCASDASCPGNERCCKTKTGQQCAHPLQERWGYCPKDPTKPGQGTSCVAECSTDDECNRSVERPWKKCCSFGCGRKCAVAEEGNVGGCREPCVFGACVAAPGHDSVALSASEALSPSSTLVPEHPGVCLKKKVVQTFAPCNDTCADDRDCPLAQKCCFTGCRRSCLDPVRRELCQLPPETGPCKMNIKRYYYSPAQKKCREFTYGGCRGNSNNFKTKEACEEACGKISPGAGSLAGRPWLGRASRIEASAGSAPGSLSATPCKSDSRCGGGVFHCFLFSFCDAAILLQGHPAAPACLVIKADGHGVGTHCGRIMHALSLLLLLGLLTLWAELTPVAGQGVPPAERCHLPPETGPCKRNLKRYYYSPAHRTCLLFTYGGCHGNSNNFETKEACEAACRRIRPEVCLLPKDPGPCEGYSERYYFNSTTKTCKMFVYGLCGGNGNRFPNKVACLRTCGHLGKSAAGVG